ncbi:putative carbohydrate-binding module family 50 protein [Diaporthe ampelina]|uniref:Putative carbohydrate-binding module family 50 protein n=1 Tax=Diaporthe ampelina TaxID=1214573 RepID=A0A0G2F726_9PEZI|nr:putative carbohydrate-binding module family 50 protein [Diaporthe ampelina]
MHSFITLSVLALAATAVAKRGCAPDPNNAGSGWYQVVTGDTLNDIAADFGTDADTLAAASDIANKDLIFPGDIVTVPCE